MNYHTIHGHDVSSFDLPSTHRLPTISAAQALECLESDTSKYLSTGLGGLDRLLSGPSSDAGAEKSTSVGGIRKGQVTEIWGPSGSGKTSLGALNEGDRVVWVDCLYPVCSRRLSAVIAGKSEALEEPKSDSIDSVIQCTCPSLPHFIALLCRPTESSVPPGTSLIVIDSLSALLNHSFPRVPDQKAGNSASRGPNSSARRLQVLQHIISALQKLAATRDLAIVVLTQCASKMQAERGASLVPAINASVWDQGIPTRLVLYRDWVMHEGKPLGLHFAGIQKVNGKNDNAAIRDIVAFRVESTGLIVASIDSSESARIQSHGTVLKRKLQDTDFEVGDSDDEDYGWAEDPNGDSMPPNPSQWQGSEDLIVGVHRQNGEDSDDEREHHHPDDEIPASSDEDEPFTQQVVGDDAQPPQV
ncbi:P-loop containing nucleoside triphosphate hydrolase protein [Coniochaeta ligniaria NRRL 30616]|uniref:p-loop containing nucleoside triphosphate hydrolase protein n=1 Tax=Coniochaeta ligniaria NRRL 30616 TaxID=1408157 RepID=A0A1J7IY33_9PEZI|nr:P-loop containing nucleoside triphosphate hydrolase protein [Coniochaeta ligniaria NRRL 30616]